MYISKYFSYLGMKILQKSNVPYLFKSLHTLMNGSGQPNQSLCITAKVMKTSLAMKASIHASHLTRLQHAVLECVKVKPDVRFTNTVIVRFSLRQELS